MSFTTEQQLIGLGLKAKKIIVSDTGEKLHCFSAEQMAKHLAFIGVPTKYRIWSIEHRAWWRHAHDGYTLNAAEAGLYPLEEAEAICRDANTHNTSEVMVPDFCAIHPELPER